MGATRRRDGQRSTPAQLGRKLTASTQPFRVVASAVMVRSYLGQKAESTAPKPSLNCINLVRGTGIEPATSSVSGKRSPAELTAPGQRIGGGDGNRTRVHGFAGRCLTTRPLHRGGLIPLATLERMTDRTRDPHLGKVMRYQLRYIRAQRARSSPGAKHDDSPIERACTNSSATSGAPLSAAPAARSAETPARANLRRHSPLGAGPVAQWESVRFTRGRSLVRSQPGPPRSLRRSQDFPVSDFRSLAHNGRGISAVYPPSRSSPEPVERIRHTIQVGIVEIRIGVRGDHDRRVAHRHLQ